MEYIGPAAATAGATIKIIEFSYKLHNTSHETSDYLNLATLIQTDLNEAIRLRNAHAQALDTPSLSRIDTVIRSTKTALSSVAALVEDFRLEIKEKGKVGMGNKLSWAFKDSREMQTKYVYLSGCQQSLLSVLAELKAVAERERERGGGAPPAYDGHYDEEEGGRLMAALASKHSVRRPRGPGGAWEMQDSSSIPSSFSQQASSPQISVNLPYESPPIAPRPAAYTNLSSPTPSTYARSQPAPPVTFQSPLPQQPPRGLGADYGYGIDEEDSGDRAQAAWLARKMSQDRRRREGRGGR